MDMSAGALLYVIGRVLVGGMFAVAGARHFFILPPLTQMVGARGVPAPRLAVILASAFEIAAGALLALGLFAAWAAAGLIAFTIAASLLLLNFWDMQSEARINAQNAFQTNVAIVGALLVLAATA